MNFRPLGCAADLGLQLGRALRVKNLGGDGDRLKVGQIVSTEDRYGEALRDGGYLRPAREEARVGSKASPMRRRDGRAPQGAIRQAAGEAA